MVQETASPVLSGYRFPAWQETHSAAERKGIDLNDFLLKMAQAMTRFRT